MLNDQSLYIVQNLARDPMRYSYPTGLKLLNDKLSILLLEDLKNLDLHLRGSFYILSTLQ